VTLDIKTAEDGGRSGWCRRPCRRQQLRGDQPGKLKIDYRASSISIRGMCLHISAYGRDNGAGRGPATISDAAEPA
jgi:hypothetical protein